MVTLLQPTLQLQGVGQIPVVAECNAPHRGRAEGRLRVLPHTRAGRGVAAMPDGQVSVAKGVQSRLVEDLRDQAHVFEDHDLGAFADRDTCRLLPAVLQRVKPEIRELGYLLVRRPDTEDATRILRSTIVRI